MLYNDLEQVFHPQYLGVIDAMSCCFVGTSELWKEGTLSHAVVLYCIVLSRWAESAGELAKAELISMVR